MFITTFGGRCSVIRVRLRQSGSRSATGKFQRISCPHVTSGGNEPLLEPMPAAPKGVIQIETRRGHKWPLFHNGSSRRTRFYARDRTKARIEIYEWSWKSGSSEPRLASPKRPTL